MAAGNRFKQQGLRLLALLLLCTLALQCVWLARVAMMRFIDPQSTSFQRSEAWRLLVNQHELRWRQDWRDLAQIDKSLQRAVIASEDAGFVDHGGVDWDAIQGAWQRNQRAQERVQRQAARKPGTAPTARIVGGSTISQQLAKNLFFSGERTAARKAQELVVTLCLESLLPKERILEIYLNQVEWGEGVFGAQAAARHFYAQDASKLTPERAARLAVMLPAPKRFEKLPNSPYVQARAATIVARMNSVQLPP